MFHAALRRQNADGFPRFPESHCDHRGVIEVGGDQQFFWRLPVLVIELFNGRSNELFIGGIGRMGPEEVLASDQQASPHKEHLQIDGRAMSREADHVLIGRSRLRDALLLERAFDIEEPIPQAAASSNSSRSAAISM